MAGFIFCHLVNCVVDGVITELFCAGCYCKFTLASASLCLCPLVKVCLGVPDNLSQEFCEFGGVLCFLEGIAPESGGYTRITLAVSLACHGKVHSYLCTLSVEVIVEALHYFRILYNSVLEVVLTGPAESFFLDFYEFFFLSAALWAEVWSFLSLMYITANETSEFLFHNFGYLYVNNSVMCFTNIVYLCNMTRYFTVGGHSFFIMGEDNLSLWNCIDNYLPFEVPAVECLFGIEICGESPEFDKKAVYVQSSKEEEQRLELYTVPEGWLVEMAPRNDMDICARMLLDNDFSRAKVYLQGNEAVRRFGLDNSLMVSYTFATATLGTLEMHASVVSNSGKAYLFLGKSGTGKSTHSRLWLQHVPGTELVNDDNPIMRVKSDGGVWLYGSPWSGKTPCYKNVSLPVGGIVRISRAKENRITRLPLVQAYASVASSCSGFRPLKTIADGLHATLSQIVSKVPCYVLDCLPDAGAALLCSENVRV